MPDKSQLTLVYKGRIVISSQTATLILQSKSLPFKKHPLFRPVELLVLCTAEPHFNCGVGYSQCSQP